MPSASAGQVHPEFFYYNGKIDYQAVIQYSRAFIPFLNETERAFYQFIIDCTARFGRKNTRIAKSEFTTGKAPSQGFAGTMPPPECSRNTFYKVLNRLQDLKLVEIDMEGNKYTLRFDTLPIEVAADPQVQKGFAARNRHNSELRTAEGILAWAGKLTKLLLDAFTITRVEPEQEEKQPEAQENKAKDVSPYSLYYKIQPSPLDKSKGNFRKLFRDIFMGKRDVSEIMQSITAGVQERRDRVTQKRKVRRTLADRAALFETEWLRGQREKNSKRPPARIVGRDRALIKSQILKNAEGTELDTDAFAYWVAHHWQAIGAQYFPNSKRYPEFPVIPWLIKCFEVYITAFEQREFLDEDGTKSDTDYMRRAAQADKIREAGINALAAADRENANLRAQLRERDRLLEEAVKSGGKLPRNDLLTDEQHAMIERGKKMQFPSYDEDMQRQDKRKRKLKRKGNR